MTKICCFLSNVLLQEAYFCRNKRRVLSQPNLSRDKKMVLVAAPVNDTLIAVSALKYICNGDQ